MKMRKKSEAEARLEPLTFRHAQCNLSHFSLHHSTHMAVRLDRSSQVTETMQVEEKSEIDDHRPDCPIHALSKLQILLISLSSEWSELTWT